MKLEKVLWFCSIIFFIGCGSQKKTVKNPPKESAKVAVVVTPKVEEKEIIETPIEKEVVSETPKEIENQKEVILTNTSSEVEEELDFTQQYINKYAAIAVREMHDYKIPASITLAQGVLESGSGRSPLALKSNNHFGIKCHKGWKGKSVSHDDDAIGECFRKYEHPETSYKDHSKFLTSRSRYSKLFKLSLTDYIGWAYGLKKAGYATDRKYPRKLIAIIKKYHLYRYDSMKVEEMQPVEESIATNSPSSIIYVVVKGDTLYSISKRHQTTVQELKDFNGLTNNIIVIGQELVIPLAILS